MMGRLGFMAALVPPLGAAAAVLDKGGPAVTRPTVWHVLGYGFEAGSMIAALMACVAVRFYVVEKSFAKHRWTLDVPVSALAMMFTAAMVVRLRLDPLMALVWGTGLGVLGAGIIALAKRYVDKALDALGLRDPEGPDKGDAP